MVLCFQLYKSLKLKLTCRILGQYSICPSCLWASMYPKYGQVVRIVLKPLIRCSLTPLSKIKFTYNHNLPKSVRWLITVILRCLLACSVAIVNKIYHHLSSFLALPRSFILRTLSLVLTIFIMWQRGQYIPKSQNAMWRKF